MKIQIQLDSQCEEPEILIRTAAVTAEIRELVEKLSEKRSDSVVGYDADSAVLLEKSEIINLHFVRRLDLGITGTIGMQLKNGETAYVSRRYVNHIKSILGL